jgi:hypothetical protein
MFADRLGDLDHLKESSGAFLHSGAPRDRGSEYRHSLCGGSRNCADDSFCRVHTDRTTEKRKLTDDDRYASPIDFALTRHDGFVFP